MKRYNVDYKQLDIGYCEVLVVVGVGVGWRKGGDSGVHCRWKIC